MLVLASSPRTTSRLGASMMSLSAPPASIGKRTAPPPTVKLVTRSGAFAARKSDAAPDASEGPKAFGPRRQQQHGDVRVCLGIGEPHSHSVADSEVGSDRRTR